MIRKIVQYRHVGQINNLRKMAILIQLKYMYVFGSDLFAHIIDIKCRKNSIYYLQCRMSASLEYCTTLITR